MQPGIELSKKLLRLLAEQPVLEGLILQYPNVKGFPAGTPVYLLRIVLPGTSITANIFIDAIHGTALVLELPQDAPEQPSFLPDFKQPPVVGADDENHILIHSDLLYLWLKFLQAGESALMHFRPLESLLHQVVF